MDRPDPPRFEARDFGRSWVIRGRRGELELSLEELRDLLVAMRVSGAWKYLTGGNDAQ